MDDRKIIVTGRGRRWKGPDEPMTPPQQKLAAQWIDMAFGHARSWAKTRPHLKFEFISASMMALVEAARNYDETMNRTFYTYLRWHLRHARKEVIRNSIPKGYRITGCLRMRRDEINASRPKMFGLDGHQEHVLGFTSGSVEDYDVVEWVKHHLSSLGSNHIYVITQMYWYGRNAQEIAGEMGCSRTDVVNIQNESLNALRRVMEAEDECVPAAVEPTKSGFIGSLVNVLRCSRGWSLEEFADKLGMEPGVLSRIESDVESPSREVVVEMAALLSQDEELFLSVSGHGG